MARPKIKPDYNAEHIMQEFMEELADAFGEYDDRVGRSPDSGHLSLNAVADEFGITALKARKLLITAGVYSTEISRRVQELYAQQKTVQEIMTLTNLSRASVHPYLPYTKIPYKLKELSANAERTKRYRERKTACQDFGEKFSILSGEELEQALWHMLEELQGCVFYTTKGLKFVYTIKGGELFVSRKSKSITKATVLMAFHKALELGGAATGPKKLGTFGASYLYPVFQRLGVVGKD